MFIVLTVKNGSFPEVQERRTSLASGPQKQHTESLSFQPLALETLAQLLTQSPGIEHKKIPPSIQ